MTQVCPGCGATLHDEINPTCYNCLRIEQEQKRYGRRRPTNLQFTPPEVKLTPLPGIKTKEKTVDAPVPVNRKRQRRGVNLLLTDLYVSPRYLSHILRDGGLSDQQIARLRQKQLPKFLDAIVAETLAFWRKKLRWQEFEMLRTKYAFDGKPAPMKRVLMKQFNISWDQIDTYREQGLKQLRYASLIKHWEKLVIRTAKEILKNS